MGFKYYNYCLLGFLVVFLISPNRVFPQQNETVNDTTEVLTATEVREWDETRSPRGYTLFAFQDTTYLIDMEGCLINKWIAGANSRLLENGNLLSANSENATSFTGFIEQDWNGNVVWSYRDKRAYVLHHDFVRIYNKKLSRYTTMYIANIPLTEEELLNAGADPSKGSYENIMMDGIVEVDMEGNIVWEWRFFDHLVQDYDPLKDNYVGNGKTVSDYPGRLNLNIPGLKPKRDWLHCNSIDYNPDLDQIVINSVRGEFYIIDHGGTFIPGNPDSSIALAAGPAGDFLYRFGHPFRYDQGDPQEEHHDRTKAVSIHRQIGGSHDVNWIKPGYPGEGKLLVFNNGRLLHEEIRQSYIHEIDPYMDADQHDTGYYVNPPDAGYTEWILPPEEGFNLSKLLSNQIVWTYYSKNQFVFYSRNQSGVRRLPNGNTLICESNSGHLFEVTPGGERVWYYINPVTLDGIVEELPVSAYLANNVFRAYRYYPGDPELSGRTLVPKQTLTCRIPDYVIPLSPTAVNETPEPVPDNFDLLQNYPNPFNPETTIIYNLKQPGNVSIKVFNLLGQEIKTLVDNFSPAGIFSVRWDGTNSLGRRVSTGVYIYSMTTGNGIKTKRMLLIR